MESIQRPVSTTAFFLCIVLFGCAPSGDEQRRTAPAPGEGTSNALAVNSPARSSVADIDPPRSSGARQVRRADPKHEQELARVHIAGNLPALMERAKNDPAFAYALSMALHQCAVAELAEEDYIDNVAPQLGGQAAEQSAADLNQLIAPCAGLQDSLAEDRFDLVDRAASAGVLEAQINYRALAADFVASEGAMARTGVMDSYKRKTLQYARAAAKTGSAEALYNAYDVLASGLFGPPNPVEAQAYLLAYQHQRATPSGGIAHLLSMGSKSLSAQELARAKALAKNLTARNQESCT